MPFFPIREAYSPQLFGHEIIALLVGVVWTFPVAFLIVAGMEFKLFQCIVFGLTYASRDAPWRTCELFVSPLDVLRYHKY